MRLKALATAISAVVIAAFVGFCSSDNPLSPYHPEITNETDNFQFQITAAENLDYTTSYSWRNTGDRASINQACAVTGGSATLMISDSTGAMLYTRDLADNGTFHSTSGAPGRWTIRVIFTSLDGTINFRVQKM